MRRRRWIIFAVIILAAASYFLWFRGVKTVVSNTGSTAMHDVRVVVTGAAYRLGDIPPGDSRNVYVNPSSESSLTIQYIDASAGARSLDIDCYIEKGNSGRIEVHIANGAIVWQDVRVKSLPW
ncbi:hypothetical protein BH10PLA1_BH10PLA1_09700 [soil metagenome]